MLLIDNLVKRYGNVLAVDNLCLSIKKGEIFGFVGPNGAGKTTTLKIVSGLLNKTSGEIFIDEIDAFKNRNILKEKIGYMPDFFGVYDNLKVYEYLEFYASIYKIYGEESKKLINDLLELVDLTDKRDSFVDLLSRGMKQRLCLSRALIHNPELLILDEPASGMDPRARYEMKEILKNLKEMGKTIIISSHILSELAEISTTIGIIEKGKIIIKGTVDEIMEKSYSHKVIEVKLLENSEKAIQLLKELTTVSKVKFVDNHISMNFNGTQEELYKMLKLLIEQGIKVISFKENQVNLEKVFMDITGKNPNDGNKEVIA